MQTLKGIKAYQTQQNWQFTGVLKNAEDDQREADWLADDLAEYDDYNEFWCEDIFDTDDETTDAALAARYELTCQAPASTAYNWGEPLEGRGPMSRLLAMLTQPYYKQ